MHKAYVLVGLGYGDEGKGAMTSDLALSLPSSLVVRFNGGSQAGHNVVTADGRHHTFSQFGSGTLVQDSETHYSKHALFNPLNLIKEEGGLRTIGVTNAFDRFSIAKSARVITPFHVEANRSRELSRGDAPHGSCAQGIGETMMGWLAEPEMTVYACDLWDLSTLRYKLAFWRDYKRAEIEAMGQTPDPSTFSADNRLIDTYASVMTRLTTKITLHGDDFVRTQLGNRPVIFEGAQGVLLDERFGFHPHTTWSTTTAHNAFDLIGDFDDVETIGIMRSYMIRHGQGPLVTHNPELAFEEPHNYDHSPQGSFRQGHLDIVALRYAVDVVGCLDSLAVTHCDRIEDVSDVCTAYSRRFEPLCDGFQVIERLSVGDIADRKHQEALTDIAFNSIPTYEEWHTSDFFAKVEESLGLPIRCRRSSPVMSDSYITT